MKQTHRIPSLAAILAFAILALSGSRLAAESVTLWISSFQDKTYYEKMVKEYQSKVDAEFKADIQAFGFREMPDKLAIAIKTGANPPDIVQLDEVLFGSYLAGEVPFVDLAERVKKAGLDQGIVPQRLKLFAKGDAVYGLPQSLSAMVLYYRADLFKEHGIKPEDLATWSDFEAEGQKLAEKNQALIALDPTYFEILLRQKGSDWFDRAGRMFPDEAEAEAVMNWLYDLNDQGIGLIPERASIFDPVFFSSMVNYGEVLTIVGAAFAQNANVDGSDLINLIRKAAENAVFDGRVIAANQADIASTLDSVVAQIHFSAEQSVKAGDPLFTLDPTEFELGVRTAQARLLGAQADTELANANYIRAQTLVERGTVTKSQLQKAKAELAGAQAALALAEVALDGARIDLESTVIRAPISGVIGRPNVSVGAYVEAEAGAPLARIVQLDPVLVAYEEPYAEQVELFQSSELSSPDAFLGLLTIRLKLTDTLIYPISSKPTQASSTLNEDRETVMLWAEFQNPQHILRPGMRVRVLTEVDEDAVREITQD